MGRFVDPDNSAFQDALSSKIYIDKMGLISYTNGVNRHDRVIYLFFIFPLNSKKFCKISNTHIQ